MKALSSIILFAIVILAASTSAVHGAHAEFQTSRLISAIRSNDYDSVAALLKSGVHVDTTTDEDEWGRTPLEVASFIGNIEIMKLLVAHNAKPDGRDRYGGTALQTACTAGQYHTASYLLELGANPNSQNNGGYTPLMCAARRAHLEIVKLLIAKGARVAMRNRDGHTALDVLKADGRNQPGAEQVADFLEEQAKRGAVTH
jgi:ankyrin repeat protein